MRTVVALLLLLCTVSCACAEPTADEIIACVDEVRSPQKDYRISVEVTSYSLKRSPKIARYEVMVKGREKAIVKTVFPLIERNRILLMRDNNLWAFFPDVLKPIRLSLQERLLGEVANGDLARVNFSGDYTPKILSTETIDGKEHYVLELVAKTRDVTYGKAILWAEKETYRPLKAEFFAASGKLLKRCSYKNYKSMAGKERPTQLTMEDPLTKGKRSVINYAKMELAEFPDKYFAKDYMKRLMD